jgi:hypothetical protein
MSDGVVSGGLGSLGGLAALAVAGLEKDVVVRFGGAEHVVRMRALSDAEMQAIIAGLAEYGGRPQPPLKTPPGKGSLAPKVPDEDDPVYQEAQHAFAMKVRRARIAAACGVEVDGESWRSVYGLTRNGVPAWSAWVRAAADLIAKSFTTAAINALAEALSGLEAGDAEAAREIEKN